MKTALVTGYRGFIGTHLCRALRDSGEYAVSGIDLKDGRHQDIRDCKLPAPSEADVCFHLAAQTNARTHDAYEDASTNILGTLHVLERYREKVVFATSVTAGNPVIPYAISKNACEHYCRLYGARIVCFRNITGPGGHGVFELFEKADILKITGDGSQKRAYTPVKHAVAALMEAANAPAGSFRVVEGTELTVLEIAELFYPEKKIEFIERDPNDFGIVTTGRRDT